MLVVCLLVGSNCWSLLMKTGTIVVFNLIRPDRCVVVWRLMCREEKTMPGDVSISKAKFAGSPLSML
jgi:hypothetical protein